MCTCNISAQSYITILHVGDILAYVNKYNALIIITFKLVHRPECN